MQQRPRLLQGAGEGGLLHPGAAEAASRTTPAAQGFAVAQEFVDVETAKQTGRAAFGEMVACLKTHPSVPHPPGREDRPALPQPQGLGHPRRARRRDPLRQGRRRPVARLPLLREVHARHQGADGQELHRQPVRGDPQGHAGEGRAGHLADPGPARLPQRRRPGRQEDHRRDPEVAPIVAKLFEWYATGEYCARGGRAKGRGRGPRLPQERERRCPTSTVHTILRNRLYTGEFDWKGKLYQGSHEPLVSGDSGSGCRASWTAATPSKHRRMKHDFAFSGLIACGHCGCAVVGEIKKQKYIYYHCTGYATMPGQARPCRRKYVREEVLEQQFTDLLGRLRFDDEVLDWVREALQPATATSGATTRRRSRGSRPSTTGSSDRIDAMYVDKLDGKIGGDFFDSMAGRMAGGAEPLPARHRAAPGGRAVLHGRGRPDSRTRPQRSEPCSNASPRAKSGGCSISYFRTAHGRMARWSPPSGNPLIC